MPKKPASFGSSSTCKVKMGIIILFSSPFFFNKILLNEKKLIYIDNVRCSPNGYYFIKNLKNKVTLIYIT
jgi:hypothetical protein